MAREWNSAWVDVTDGGDADYTDAVRRMIMAAINWIEDHPDVILHWEEISTASLLQSLGVVAPKGADVWVTAEWRQMIRPASDGAVDWFNMIEQSCPRAPTYMMMMKAIACGILFRNKGWDAFNRFMLSGGKTMTLN